MFAVALTAFSNVATMYGLNFGLESRMIGNSKNLPKSGTAVKTEEELYKQLEHLFDSMPGQDYRSFIPAIHKLITAHTEKILQYKGTVNLKKAPATCKVRTAAVLCLVGCLGVFLFGFFSGGKRGYSERLKEEERIRHGLAADITRHSRVLIAKGLTQLNGVDDASCVPSTIQKQQIYAIPDLPNTSVAASCDERTVKKAHESETAHLREVSLAEQLKGPLSSELAIACVALAEDYRAEQDYTQALTFYRRAISIWQKSGRDTEELAIALVRAAECSAEQRSYTESDTFYQQALAMWCRMKGANSKESVRVRKELTEAKKRSQEDNSYSANSFFEGKHTRPSSN